ncbi:hypothetical protein [Nonomuraea bangladeshensis]|uniref:hypothetical protein n=1 Tax=Nonomuraea bangladeshensis TaxID=404385 RepID=UPI003C2FD326
MSTRPSTRRAARWLLAFAVVGGVLAWAAHLLVAWAVVEVACSIGHPEVAGVPVRLFALLATVLPGVVAVAALAVAWRLRLRHLTEPEGRRERRARFLAELGLGLNAFSCLMILFGAVAVAVLAACG